MSLLPWWAKALIAAGIALLAYLLITSYNEALRDEGRAEVRAEWNQAVEKAQADEGRRAAWRAKRDKEIEDETSHALSRLAADAAGSRAAADRLQHRVDELVAAARRQAGAGSTAGGPAPGQQGADAIELLAYMHGRLDAFASGAGGYADRLRIAGQGCEARFDGLTESQLSPAPGTGASTPSAP